MTIQMESHLFEWCKTRAWNGGASAAHYFSMEELNRIEEIIEEIYPPEGINETELNDLFWFDTETICEWLEIDYKEWENREKQW